MRATKKLVGAAVAAALGLAATNAQAAVALLDVTEMSITGGAFELGVPPAPGNAIIAGDVAPIVTGTYQGAPTNTAADSLATFQFGFFGPVGTHTADNLDGGLVSVNQGPLENPAPITAKVDPGAGMIYADMGSWFAFWNGTSFNQGDHNVTGTFDPGTGAYNISWSSYISGGPFDTNTGYWQLEGVATVVPVPAAVWMFGSAVVGFAAMAKRKKAAA
jgi:hypothetical protein